MSTCCNQLLKDKQQMSCVLHEFSAETWLSLKLQDILLSNPDGVFLDELCDLFSRRTKEILDIHRFGYPTLESFISAIPTTARLEFSVRDKCMKVLVVKPMNIQVQQEANKNSNSRHVQMDHDGVNGTGIMGPPGQFMSRRPSGPLPVGHNSRAGVLSSRSSGLLGQIPDNRGSCLLCFPAENRPELKGHGYLKNLFGLAGNVSEINETAKWIYVSYIDPQAAARALQMFSHLGMIAYKAAAIDVPLQKCPGNAESKLKEGNKRFQQKPVKQRTPAERAKRLKYREKKLSNLENAIKVYVGNLDPAVKYTFDMFRNLFKGFRLEWVTLKSVNKEDDHRVFAFVHIYAIEKALELCNKFNGYIWMGRTLKVHLKRRFPKRTDGQENSDISCDWSDSATNSSLPELAELSQDELYDMPGLEPLMPGLESDMPGLEPCMPGLDSGMPGWEPAMPGLEPTMPGLEPTMPGLEPSMPGLEPSMPGLEPSMPGLELVPSGSRARSVKSDVNSRPRSVQSDVGSRWGPDSSPPSSNNNTPTIIVANFKEGTTQDDLLNRFAAYGAKSVNLVPTHLGRHKAYIRLGSVEDVKRAVNEVNQTPYNGLKILVDIPYNMPALREAVLGLQVDQVQPNIGSGVTLSEILKMRGACLQILQSPEFPLSLGQQIKVLITTVISDKFFWGQIVDRPSFDRLFAVSEKLNQPDNHIEPASGPGRCSAVFQGDGKWYRAWLTHTGLKSDLVRVFYLDYGNTAAVPWSHTNKVVPRWVWDLCPLAIPFALTEPVTNLKNRELTHMMVEINALGGLEEGNMVVVRATSLVPNLLESMSSVGHTVIA